MCAVLWGCRRGRTFNRDVRRLFWQGRASATSSEHRGRPSRRRRGATNGQPVTLVIILMTVISQRAGSCLSLCGCLQRASVPLSCHCFSPLLTRSFLSVQGDSDMSLFEGNCVKHLGQEKKYYSTTQAKAPRSNLCNLKVHSMRVLGCTEKRKLQKLQNKSVYNVSSHLFSFSFSFPPFFS